MFVQAFRFRQVYRTTANIQEVAYNQNEDSFYWLITYQDIDKLLTAKINLSEPKMIKRIWINKGTYQFKVKIIYNFKLRFVKTIFSINYSKNKVKNKIIIDNKSKKQKGMKI